MMLGISHIYQEHKLKMFEDKVLRRIFESNRDEARGGYGKLAHIIRNLIILISGQIRNQGI
jgi:hypothetical protein